MHTLINEGLVQEFIAIATVAAVFVVGFIINLVTYNNYRNKTNFATLVAMCLICIYSPIIGGIALAGLLIYIFSAIDLAILQDNPYYGFREHTALMLKIFFKMIY